MAEIARRRLIECTQSTAPAAKRVEAAVALTAELFSRGDIEGLKAVIDQGGQKLRELGRCFLDYY